MRSRLITIQGKVVNYGLEEINQIYGLLNHDIKSVTNKDCVSGVLLASKLCPSTKVSMGCHQYQNFSLKLDRRSKDMDVNCMKLYFPKW